MLQHLVSKETRSFPAVVIADADVGFRNHLAHILCDRFRIHEVADGLAVLNLLNLDKSAVPCALLRTVEGLGVTHRRRPG
jgi:hypothetical protein